MLSFHASLVLSTPTDEFGRIVTGLTYLRDHDYRMDFATPPLAKYLVAAPLLFTDVDLALEIPRLRFGMTVFCGFLDPRAAFLGLISGCSGRHPG